MADTWQDDRARMVELQLRGRGIHSPLLLEAFREVPRHEFVPREVRAQAYSDGPLAIGQGQTISQPYMVALMTQLAEIVPGCRVLEIGTGSGYQCAILAAMGAHVYTVERVPWLQQQAQQTLSRLGYLDRVHLRLANGTLGWQEEAPYDAILVTAAAPALPEPLKAQLGLGGRLVIPIEEDGPTQTLWLIRRTRAGFQEERKGLCTFVPLIGEHGWGGGEENR